MSGALDLVETLYRLDADDDTWIATLCRQASTIAPPHRGVVVVQYQAAHDGAHIVRQCSVDCEPDVVRALSGMVEHTQVRRPLLRPGFVCDFGHSIQPAEVRPLFDQAIAPYGIWDVLGLKSLDDEGHGLWCGINLIHPKHASDRELRRWTYVGRHVDAAFRLRQLARMGHSHDGPVRALDALRAAAMKRGTNTNAPPANELWSGLANGRWALLDRFDAGGRRYVIARRSDPRWSGPPELTSAERQVVLAAAEGHSNKVIAYRLGLPESTVATQLSVAMRKLGAESRVDLVKLVGELLQ